MEAQMQLAELDKFGEIECAVYRDSAGECYFTREQIGQALGYSDPGKSIDKIHSRHRERMGLFSTTVTLGVVEGGRHVQREMTLYSRKGVMEICRWSRQPLADAFIDWVWEITDRLISGSAELVSSSAAPAAPSGAVELLSGLERLDARVSEGFDILGDGLMELGQICAKFGEILTRMDKTLGKADVFLSRMDDGLCQLDGKLSSLDSKVSHVQTVTGYSNYYLRSQMRSGYDERWKEIQGPRLKAAAEYLGMDSKLLLREIYQEMELRYGVRLDDFVNDYKRQKRVTTCSTLSVISFSATLREKFDTILSDVLDICGIEMPSMPARSRLMEMALSAAAERRGDS